MIVGGVVGFVLAFISIVGATVARLVSVGSAECVASEAALMITAMVGVASVEVTDWVGAMTAVVLGRAVEVRGRVGVGDWVGVRVFCASGSAEALERLASAAINAEAMTYFNLTVQL